MFLHHSIGFLSRNETIPDQCFEHQPDLKIFDESSRSANTFHSKE